MKQNRKREIVVSTILLVISLIGGVFLFISGKAANFDNFGSKFSYSIVFIFVGWITDAILFVWSLNGLLMGERKKWSDEEIRKKIEPLKPKRKSNPLAYAPGEDLAKWRQKAQSKRITLLL